MNPAHVAVMISIALFVGILVCLEVGYRVGRQRETSRVGARGHRRYRSRSFALLVLLLGFSLAGGLRYGETQESPLASLGAVRGRDFGDDLRGVGSRVPAIRFDPPYRGRQSFGPAARFNPPTIHQLNRPNEERRREMKIARLSTGVILMLVGVPLRAQTQQQAQPTPQGLTLTGKLVRAMAMGGESTGWVLELESPARIDGKLASAIQVDYGKTDVLEELANKRVRVSGELTHRHGVETGDQPVLKASSIREAKTGAGAPSEPKSAFKLVGTEWRLADLAGAAVLEHTQPTLAFPEAGKVE